MEEQILEILKDMQSRFDRLEGRFDSLEGKVDRLEGRFDKLEGKVDRLEGRFDKLEGKVDGLEGRFDKLERKADKHDERFDKLEKGQDGIILELQEFRGRFTDFESKSANNHVEVINKIADVQNEMNDIEFMTAKNMKDIAHLKAIK